uniref:WRKY1 n=1 Tax=Caragana korshinskii TaxID=220689 RepID=U5JEB7_9FABA|nr:WRKY1 [Caragana korshinskii]
MDCSPWINTSLDLNINPRRVHEEVPKYEVESNLFSLGMSLRKPSAEEESSGALVEELKRVSAENKKLTEMLAEMCENYNTLRYNLMEYMRKNPPADNKELSPPMKRKSEFESSSNNNIHCNLISTGVNNNNNGNSESSSSDEESLSCKKPPAREETIKAKVSRVYCRTESSDASLIVKDGYQWRKYGQKVTRDNPSPRAYFKCSFAPTCPVKKKVQRSVDDPSVVVATYEGEHNHPHPSQMEPTSGSNRCRTPISSASHSSCAPTVTLDWTKSKSSSSDSSKNVTINPKIDTPEVVPQILVEQMASSLTKDPNFRAALAAAMSGKMLHRN